MKILSVIALVLGLIAISIGLYHLIETYPNIKAFGKMYLESNAPLDQSMWQSYRSAGWMQIYAIWGVGGLGLISGVIAAIKEKEKMRLIAIAGGVLSLVALIISMTTMMAGRVG
jgi:hypothetical protein